ncbi:MAG TPA: FAD-dependent oxidoreductase [Blastocatellia bacterium]|nr:FAD-dependent oxidoreductase [Blastocatellia bacterium]
MATHQVRLKSRQEIAEGTMAFHFEKPPGFTFKAGQALACTLIDPPETDDEGSMRNFSIASAPVEPDLMIATRMRDSAFKRVLKTMPLGTEVRIVGPFGSLTLRENSAKPAVFLAGGIGITPFRSMLRQAAEQKLPHHLFLFYSNRRPEDAAFLEELQDLENENSNYKFIGTMTKMAGSNRVWRGETGFINPEMLAKYIGDLAAPIYYIAGPPAMVAAMRQTLILAGVNSDDVRAEEFAGY